MGLGRYCILFSAKPNFGFYFDAFPRWQKWSGTDSGKYSILELQGCSYFASDLFVVCFSQNLPLPTQIKTTRISLLNTSEYLWGGLNIPQRYRANFTCHATILAGHDFFELFGGGFAVEMINSSFRCRHFFIAGESSDLGALCGCEEIRHALWRLLRWGISAGAVVDGGDGKVMARW